MSKRVSWGDTKLMKGGSEVDDPLDKAYEIWLSKQTSEDLKRYDEINSEDSYIDIILEYKWLIVIAILIMMYFLYNYMYKKKNNKARIIKKKRTQPINNIYSEKKLISTQL